MHMRRIASSVVSGSTVFLHSIINGTSLGKSVIEHKMYFDFLHDLFLKLLCFKANWASYKFACLQAKYSLSVSDFNEI
jgi:hypothetical protein